MDEELRNPAWLTSMEVPVPLRRNFTYYRSPADWRAELIYFLLPDRFNDKGEKTRSANLIDRSTIVHNPPAGAPLKTWYWDMWAISGRSRFQGGTLQGIIDQLGYLHDLGITTLWLGPMWKQRAVGVDQNVQNVPGDATCDPYREPDLNDVVEAVDFEGLFRTRDDYHGYSIQDFLSVDPRFGTTADLCNLVAAAHDRSIRVIFDVLINHSGENWLYQVDEGVSALRPPYIDGAQPYDFGAWLDADNKPMMGDAARGPDDAVWPQPLQDTAYYSRRGQGSYSADKVPDTDTAEYRVADYFNRDFEYEVDPARVPLIDIMVRIWSYWMATTDCDGFRVDTFKHVPRATAQQFTLRIREFAKKKLKKADFLVIGEIGGADRFAAGYLARDPTLRVLELSERRNDLRHLAGGNVQIMATAVLLPTVGNLGGGGGDHDLSGLTDEVLRDHVVTSIDDHDGLGLNSPARIAQVEGPQSVVPAMALLLFGPGIPSLYHGTEQALSGPVGPESYLQQFGWLNGSRDPGADRYLREALFGPVHPRPAGRAGRDDLGTRDVDLPGFGPFGTTGQHVFDVRSPWYRAVRTLARLRRRHDVLALGDIEVLDLCNVSGGRFDEPLPPGIVAWVRRRQDQVALIVLNVADRAGSRPGIPIDVVLPPWWPTLADGRLIEQARADDRGNHPRQRDSRGDVVQTLPQSCVSYVSIGVLPSGQVRVFGQIAAPPPQWGPRRQGVGPAQLLSALTGRLGALVGQVVRQAQRQRGEGQ